MTKTEIEFLRSAGFSIAEIMAMNPVQNDEKDKAAEAGSAPSAEQNAQKDPATPDPAPAPATAPVEPAPAQSAAGDPQAVILDKLDKLIAAIQAGNRSGAAVQTSEKKTPEEIAGQLY